jgi:glyoxylase-like metal-dependent hydrolase (beta-lactamase superfamily II)
VARVIPIPNGPFVQNCYLVAPKASTEAAIVDPGEEVDRFLERARRESFTIGAIWLTHAHVDHVLGVAAVQEATGAPIYLHPADRPLYDRAAEQAELFGIRARRPPPPDRELAHGDTLSLGEERFRVRHTPGHSAGSVCLVGDGLAFVGDVLFQGSIGRTDLPGGNHERLLRSIQEELLVLPDDTLIYSGHGPVTTIGAERRTNPFLVGLEGVP